MSTNSAGVIVVGKSVVKRDALHKVCNQRLLIIFQHRLPACLVLLLHPHQSLACQARNSSRRTIGTEIECDATKS